MTRPDFIPLEPSLYASRGRSHPRAHPALAFANSSPQRRRHGGQHSRGRLFTTPPDQIAPRSSYSDEVVGSPFEDALSPVLVNQEQELGLGLVEGHDSSERPSSSGEGSSGMGLGLGLGFGFELEEESRIEQSEETVQPVAEKRAFKDVKALIMASPNPQSSSFQITNPALHLRNLHKRLPAAAADPPSPRGSPDMVARYYDPLSPFQIYAPSTPESPVVPPSPGPSQTTIALGVVLALVVLGMFGGVSLYLVKKKRRRRQEEQLAEVEQLEKGLGGGKGPPIDVDPVPLWGKRLSHFERESKRLGLPPAALLRDQRRLSVGRSEKAKSRLSQSHLPVITEGGESDGDLVGRALNLELPMVVGVSELRLEGHVGGSSTQFCIGADEDDQAVAPEDEQRPRPGSTLPSRHSSDLLLQPPTPDSPAPETVGPPNTPEQAAVEQPTPTPEPSFLAHLADSPLRGLQAEPVHSTEQRSSVSSSIYTVDSTDSVLVPIGSPSYCSNTVDSPASSTFFSPDSPSEAKFASSTFSAESPSAFTSTRPRSDSKSSTVESVKSIDLLKTAIGKRFTAGSKTYSLPSSPPAATQEADSMYDQGSILLKSVGAEGITTISSPAAKGRPISEQTNVVPPAAIEPVVVTVRRALTDPFSPSYETNKLFSARAEPSTPVLRSSSISTPMKTPSPPPSSSSAPQSSTQTRRAALISTFASSSPSALAGKDLTRFGITVKPSLLPLHNARMARAAASSSARPATTYGVVASPPSPSPITGGSIASELTKGPGPASAALARASSLPSKLPSIVAARRPSTTWRGMTLPSYSLPPTLPPLPERDEVAVASPPTMQRAQTLPNPTLATPPIQVQQTIPTISITDPTNHTRPHPTHTSAISPSSTTSSFESGWELGPAWTASPRREDQEAEEEEDEFAYDYGAHFAEFSFETGLGSLEEEEREEDGEGEGSDTETLREREGVSAGRFVIGGKGRFEEGSDSGSDEEGEETEDDDGEEGLEKFGFENFPRVPERLHLPVV